MACGDEGAHALGELVLDGLGGGAAIEDLGGHIAPSAGAGGTGQVGGAAAQGGRVREPAGCRLPHGRDQCCWRAVYRGLESASAAVRRRSEAISARPVRAWAITSATSANSSLPKPRVARAGVPMRSPEVTRGGRGSLGTALRLTVIPTSCRRSSACWPDRKSVVSGKRVVESWCRRVRLRGR